MSFYLFFNFCGAFITYSGVHPDADTYVSSTKIIAILPLDTSVKLRPKELKDFTPEQIVEMENSEALSIQKAIYSWWTCNKKSSSRWL